MLSLHAVYSGGRLFAYSLLNFSAKTPTEKYAGKEDINGSRINPEETKGSLTYMGFSVPLLQNLLMDKRRAALKQAKAFRELSEVQRRIAVNDLLLEATKTYWDWWEQYHINQLMQTSLQMQKSALQWLKPATA